MALTDPNCKVCVMGVPSEKTVTASDWLYGTPGSSKILICSSCGSGWLSSDTSTRKARAHYPAHYYSYEVSKESGLPRQIRRALISRRLNAGLEVQNGLAKFLARLLPNNMVKGIPDGKGRLLDVGCGSGASISDFVDAGMEVWGVDIDERALGFAKMRGIRTVLGEFKDVELPESYFDTVRMWHSLEHMSNPLSALSKAKRVLRHGGTLLIGTPDICSLSARLFGPKWYHLDPPRHLVLFSKHSVAYAARTIGFKVQSVSTWSDRGFLGSFLVLLSSFHKGNYYLRALINSPVLALAEWPLDVATGLIGKGDHVELRCQNLDQASEDRSRTPTM